MVLPPQCPNLKAIQSMGAGVDSMIHEPSLPRHVPLLRVIDPLSECDATVCIARQDAGASTACRRPQSWRQT